jgi:hypothetical protein
MIYYAVLSMYYVMYYAVLCNMYKYEELKLNLNSRITNSGASSTTLEAHLPVAHLKIQQWRTTVVHS